MRFPGRRQRVHFSPGLQDPGKSAIEDPMIAPPVFDVAGIDQSLLSQE